MLRLFTRVTLGAGAAVAAILPPQPPTIEGNIFVVNDIDLAPESQQYNNSRYYSNKEKEQPQQREEEELDESSEETESEIEEVSADLRENLLVNRRHKKNNYTVSFSKTKSGTVYFLNKLN
uniref:Uncharacterized protein n=1 Tax=Panagrolaimus sp. PS1159 TaxID=55785 RepID=A0AC35GLI2_9BILA